MKKLLKGMLLLSFFCMETSCTTKKSVEMPMDTTDEERTYDIQDYEFSGTNILHYPLIFTAGKAWLSQEKMPEIRALTLSC